MEKISILLVGATGRTGRYIIKSFQNQNFRLKALVRNKAKAEKILGPNIECIEGDLRRVRDIQNAMEGVEGLWINLGISPFETEKDWHPMAEGMKFLLICARINNVKHIISHGLLAFSDSQRNEQNLWRVNLHQTYFNLIAKSGIPFTYFRTSVFMENFLCRLRKGNEIQVYFNTDQPISLISASDLGQEISNAFFNPSFFNQSPLVFGPDSYYLLDAAKKFVENWPNENLKLVNRESNFYQLLSRLRPGMEEELDWFKQVKSINEGLLKKSEAFKIETKTNLEDFIKKHSEANTFTKRLDKNIEFVGPSYS